MCLIIEKDTKLETVKEDIIVYKVLCSENEEQYAYSIYQEFKYELNKLYKTKITSGNDFSAADEISQKLYNQKMPGWQLGKSAKSIEEGFHFAFTSKRMEYELSWREGYPCIYECIIPRGSTIFRDISGLGVSNQIIINKKIK